MSGDSTVYLMYHELEVPGRPLCQSFPGYVRYVSTVEEFRQQIGFLKTAGYCGLSVSDAVRAREGKNIAITFDDGSETDLIAAAPILREAGFGATFYLTLEWIGEPGFLSAPQVRELASHGFEIGCHSMTHAYLIDLDESGLRHEIIDAKVDLERILSAPVRHFSCPGGRYDKRAVLMARTAGYETVTTSRIYANSAETDLFALGRVAILRGTSLTSFAGICSGEALPRMRLQSNLRTAVQRLFGNSIYDRMREVLLGRQSLAH